MSHLDWSIVWHQQTQLLALYVAQDQASRSISTQETLKGLQNLLRKANLSTIIQMYRVADKSLARPWKETNYKNQDFTIRLMTYKQQQYITVIFTPYVLV